jgi:penicillin-binding protein 2
VGPRDAIRDTGREAAIHRGRVFTASVIVLLALASLFYRYFGLQIVNYQQFLTQSERNRVRLEALPPTRGLIFDRNGELLASNEPSQLLAIVVERAGDLSALLDRIESLIGLDPEERIRFQQRRRRSRPYDAVPLKLRLTDAQTAVIGVNRHTLPGATIEAQLTRAYPHGELLSHVLGYVGRINTQETQRIEEDRYRGTFHIGKVGLEKYYEEVLLGRVGNQNIEANAHGRVLRVLDQEAPHPGTDLKLHLDLELQRVAAAALGDQRGAVVALDPRNGGVLALVSKPSFDGNLFVNGISTDAYSALRDSPDTPLLNRAIQGQYPPGSTVKPMLALTGLELGLITPETTVKDPGWYQIPGDSRRYRDWILRIRGTGHAEEVDLRMAIAESCDVYYYDLARNLGIDRLSEGLAPYGFGQATGIDITSEQRGILPSREWKQGKLGQPWYPGETLSVGIGQGYMLATPLQLAQAAMIVANRGEAFKPALVSRIGNDERVTPRREKVVASPAHWSAVIASMMDVVHTPEGTAAAIGADLAYTIAGKTGTAQVIGIAQDAVYDEDKINARHRNHGWFMAFAPVDRPSIAIAVLAENGGGSSAAYPVARKVMDAWMTRGQDG